VKVKEEGGVFEDDEHGDDSVEKLSCKETLGMKMGTPDEEIFLSRDPDGKSHRFGGNLSSTG